VEDSNKSAHKPSLGDDIVTFLHEILGEVGSDGVSLVGRLIQLIKVGVDRDGK
jgi:hypothetical protein